MKKLLTDIKNAFAAVAADIKNAFGALLKGHKK